VSPGAAAAALARAAEAGIHCLPIPTPFQIGRVNAYLIEDDPLTLLDTGPNSAGALDEVERGLAAHGRRVEDLELIVISHWHLDHFGLARVLQRRSGAEVAALDRLAPWLGRYAEGMDAADAFAEQIMAEHGVPKDVGDALMTAWQGFRGWGAAVTVTRPLADRGELALRDRTLRVLHRPGHSPSDTIFHDAEHGIVLGGDHLIKHISSNPLIARPLDWIDDDGDGHRPQRTRALVDYTASLRATREMRGVDLVLAGHGNPVVDPVALIDERLGLHARRAEKIRRLIARQPLTAHDIAQALWGDVAVTQAYLTLSEVLGHVDLLLDQGLVVEQRREDGLVRFAGGS
jgi:glyoxylase-like metal-dependent hydrolase (beta-lactamase superfamily II)